MLPSTYKYDKMNPETLGNDRLAKNATQEVGALSLCIPEKKIVCVAYPGKVVNVERALQTLGGEEKFSQKIIGSSQRLPLHFRPEDNFCKPLYGNKYSTTNLLLKVTRKKEGHASKDGSQALSSSSNQHSDKSSDEYSCEVMGVVDRTYKFQGMSDFQYLPLERRSDGTYEDLSQDLLPDATEDSSFVKKDMPLLLLPGSFSRMDTPSNYFYQKENTGTDPTLDDNLIGKRRKKRTSGTYILTYDCPEFPTKPHEDAVLKMERLKLNGDAEKLKKLFEERPVWTRMSLLAQTNATFNNLKDILPVVACYFVSGPWRTTWCRIGYNPRKEKSSRMYQVVDFRMRKEILSKTKSFIQRRRTPNLFSVPATQVRPENKGPSVLTKSGDEEEISRSTNTTTEAHYVLREGLIPPHYNMCYQFCDLQAEELKDIIADAEVSETCDPKSGWFSPDLCNQLRDKMSEIVHRTASKILEEEAKQPLGEQMEVDEEEEEEEDDDDDDEDEDDKVDLSDGEGEEEEDDDSENEHEMELLSYLEPTDG